MQEFINSLHDIAGLSKDVYWNARGTGTLAARPVLDNLYHDTLGFIDRLGSAMASVKSAGVPSFPYASTRGLFPQTFVQDDNIETGLGGVRNLLLDFVENLDNYFADPSEDAVLNVILSEVYETLNNYLWIISAEISKDGR